jgi:hypothetical protein
MATVLTDSANYAAIADAIRAKTGSTATYKPREMAAAIDAIRAATKMQLTREEGTAETNKYLKIGRFK